MSLISSFIFSICKLCFMYFPQICGNGEAVKYLSEWLHRWHSRGPRTTRGCMDEYTSIVQDIDHDYQQSESDTDDGEESLKNVLLVTGPVGVNSAFLYILSLH